jgi:antitoxin ParD1/3/4
LEQIPIFGTFVKTLIIMARNTSISLGDYFDDFIKGRISAGRYNNASEVVRAGLRLLEEEENKIIALKDAIKEGIESGIATDFNPTEHLAKLKANRKKNA